MKSKHDIFDALNKLVITEIPDAKSQWEDEDFQKKISTTLGIKTKANDLKRNKSSYLFFCQEMRPQIVSENPNIRPNQIMIILGEKWAQLSCDDRKKYNDLALDDKKRYTASKEFNKKNKPAKISAYLQFCADERPSLKIKYPDLPTKMITSKLGSMWNDYKQNNPKYLKTKYGFNIECDSS
jgi:hypothetical protein